MRTTTHHIRAGTERAAIESVIGPGNLRRGATAGAWRQWHTPDGTTIRIQHRGRGRWRVIAPTVEETP